MWNCWRECVTGLDVLWVFLWIRRRTRRHHPENNLIFSPWGRILLFNVVIMCFCILWDYFCHHLSSSDMFTFHKSSPHKLSQPPPLTIPLIHSPRPKHNIPFYWPYFEMYTKNLLSNPSVAYMTENRCCSLMVIQKILWPMIEI